MRIAEYKQIDTQVIETTIPILDEDGNETGEVETIRKEVPVMGMVYRDMTAEEEAEAAAEAERMAEIERNREPTAEERIAELEARNEMLVECLLELADIIYA